MRVHKTGKLPMTSPNGHALAGHSAPVTRSMANGDGRVLNLLNATPSSHCHYPSTPTPTPPPTCTTALCTLKMAWLAGVLRSTTLLSSLTSCDTVTSDSPRSAAAATSAWGGVGGGGGGWSPGFGVVGRLGGVSGGVGR